ncbi:hypothetical protein [Micromonospora sp. NPDC023814]|uniref:hypothetical protein n=1 Tax=Micromonospora sp. NPDC023814 TaxID=3154596 RepID=UPI0033EDA5E6
MKVVTPVPSMRRYTFGKKVDWIVIGVSPSAAKSATDNGMMSSLSFGNIHRVRHQGSRMVLVLGKLPGHEMEEPVPTTTYPGGIGETEQMTVVAEVAGVRMVQVLGKLPGHEMDEPWAMMTNPLGMAETLHITVVPVVGGVVIVQVLGKLPGHEMDEPSAMMT